MSIVKQLQKDKKRVKKYLILYSEEVLRTFQILMERSVDKNLTRRTGGLSGSFDWQGSTKYETFINGSEKTVNLKKVSGYKTDKTGAEITVGSSHPAAGIHETGGKIKTTDKMRGFFFARYSETDDKKWLFLGIGATANEYFKIKPTRYISKALKDLEKQQIGILRDIAREVKFGS